ncbi:diguanylate cyclase, partial [Micromonospora zhanjiangensis]
MPPDHQRTPPDHERAPSDHERTPPDHERISRDVTANLPAASSAIEACQLTVTALGRHTPARISVLLWVHDRLRCVAATGSWQAFATVRPGTGVVGRAYESGKTVLVSDVTADPDYLPMRPDVTAEICVPVPDRDGRPIGVLDLEWTGPVDLERWRQTAETIAGRLGLRIWALGGPAAESRSEKLLRHVTAMTAAPDEFALRAAAREAARDLSGLDAAVLALAEPTGGRISAPAGEPGDLETRIRVALDAAGPATLARLIAHTHRFGATYTLGEAATPSMPEHDLFVRAGVGTLVAVSIGPTDAGGVLLVADERLLQPDPTTVNLMELLAAQAWTCLDRLRGISLLRLRASSDPLTGLRHQGPFGERMAAANPDRTALLAIDVDGFKSVNDTYGHAIGDRVLVELARALEAALRQGDELYRIGGDEFVAVVEVGRPEEALGIAERLTEAASRTGRTISVGVALRHPGEPAELTLRRADT